jgi:hypothetical protein
MNVKEVMEGWNMGLDLARNLVPLKPKQRKQRLLAFKVQDERFGTSFSDFRGM